MVIYSEILGKQFDSVDECLYAEEQYNLRLEENARRRKQEQEKAEKAVKEGYDTLVNAWRYYLKALDKAGYDVEGMEDKALIFVEVVLDADTREADSLKNQIAYYYFTRKVGRVSWSKTQAGT